MRRLNQFKLTEAMAIDVMAKSMTGKVYNLSAGDPDLDICDAIVDAYKTTDLQRTHNYCSSQGSIDLRKKLWHDPDEVIVAGGAKQLIYESLAVTSRPGDKVLLIGPCWTSFMKICEIQHLDYTLLCGDSDSLYTPSIHQIQEAMSPEVTAIVVNTPNNPTGYVMDEETLEAIYAIAEENDAWLIVDEIYRALAQNPVGNMQQAKSTNPVGSMRGRERTIVIDGFSKNLNLTGWRAGYCVAPKEVITAMTALQSQLSGPSSTLIQDILTRAWDDIEFSSYENYRERIEVLCDIEKFNRHKPQGGFYFYLPIDQKWNSSIELCEYMLKNHRIAITPGDSYGVPRTVRISVSSISVEDLLQIRDILREI